MKTHTLITVPLMAVLVALGLATAAWGQGADGASAKEADARMQADIAARKATTDAAAKKAKAMAADAARETPTSLAKIVPVKGVEFERSYFTMEAALSPRAAATVEVFGDGTCRYLRAGEGLVTEHKMAGERVKRLSALLAKTKWLTDVSGGGSRGRDGATCTAKVMRTLEQGTGSAVVFDSGAEEPYKGLALFVWGVIQQEELWEKISAGNEEGLDELARYMSGGGNPSVEIDLGRYREEMVKVARDPLDRKDKQVATAVHAMAYYKARGERKWVEALANDRSGLVREAVAETLADFGGVESVTVLRKMVHRTRAAGLGLVRMGKEAVPAVVEIIDAGKSPETDAEQVEMIRAYVDNWEKVPQPVDERVVAAVKRSLAAAQARQDGSEMRYHENFLELVSKAGTKGGR